MGLSNYRLNDGSIYWHALYYNNVPQFMLTKGLVGWNLAYLLIHPWVIFTEAYYRTKWFFQRGWRGYGDCDVWSLDYYLLTWLPEALEVLQKTKHGYPGDVTPEQWDEMLKTMIEGLKASKKWCDMDWKTDKDLDALIAQSKEGLRLFGERFHDLWV